MPVSRSDCGGLASADNPVRKGRKRAPCGTATCDLSTGWMGLLKSLGGWGCRGADLWDWAPYSGEKTGLGGGLPNVQIHGGVLVNSLTVVPASGHGTLLFTILWPEPQGHHPF